MDRPHNLSTSEVIAMLRLANRLHVMHDPMSRKRSLIEGLCELVGGSAGTCVVVHTDPETQKATVISGVVYRASAVGDVIRHYESASGAPSAPAWPRKSANDGNAPLESRLQLPDSTVAAILCLFHLPDQKEKFTSRHRRLIDLFHAEVNWIYQTDVLLASPDALSLSPRARQTLEHLLAGLSEKEIATRLLLSPNTVHHYVKSIHKHFGVSSRSELLARWVGK